ncbi:MAG: TonB-dependent receptor, partial [Bacteroidota bacterium]|nr:TonB-dependent receptor [Bacteroidota bacterium]
CAGVYEGRQFHGGLQCLVNRSQRGVPGSVVQGRVEFAQARLDESELLAVVWLRIPSVGIEWRSTGRHGWLQYRDPEARIWGPRGAYDDATAWEASMSLKWGGVLWGMSTEFWAGARREAVVGTLLRPQGQDAVERQSAGLAALVRSTIGLGELFGSVRWEAHRQNAPGFSPTVGFQRMFGRFRLQLQWSRNFRPPAFAELYYFNFGNSKLRPERTSSWNMGLEWRPETGVQLRADLFSLWVRDQILAVPRSPVFWSAQNIGRVWSRGVEISATGRVWDWIQLFGQVTWQRVADLTGNPYTHGHQLPYVPVVMAALRGTASLSPAEVMLQLTAVGERWSQPDNAPDSRLPPHALTDVVLSYSYTPTPIVAATARLAFRNVLDTAHELVRGYPLPGRSLRVELELRWTPQGDSVSHARH